MKLSLWEFYIFSIFLLYSVARAESVYLLFLRKMLVSYFQGCLQFLQLKCQVTCLYLCALILCKLVCATSVKLVVRIMLVIYFALVITVLNSFTTS